MSFLETGFLEFGQIFDQGLCQRLLEKIRATRDFENLFMAEADFRANPLRKGVNPVPGRNLLEDLWGHDMAEGVGALSQALQEFLGLGMKCLDAKIVSAIPSKWIPAWVMTEIKDSPVPNLGAFIKPEYRDITYFHGIDWHQDIIDYPDRKSDFVTLYVYLDDVGPNDSPLNVLLGSHVRGAETFPHDVSSPVHESRCLTGPAGSAYLWHACTLHGTAPGISNRISLRYIIAADETNPLINQLNATIKGPLSLTETRRDLDADGKAAIKGNILAGSTNSLTLRAMTTEDLETILPWRNDPSIRRNMYQHDEISLVQHFEWWQRTSHDKTKKYLLAVNADGRPVGAVNFTNISLEHKTADWAFYKDPNSAPGTGSQMERLALDYAFKTLALEKLSCEVLAFNKAVVKMHRKHGFQIEGVFKKAHFFEGERHDIVRLAIFSKDWRRAAAQTLFGRYASRWQTFSQADIDAFCLLTKDHNEIHIGTETITPGLLTASAFPSIISEMFPGAIYLSQTLDFRQKVLPGTLVNYHVVVISQVGRKVCLQTRATDAATDALVLEGEALVLLP